MELIKTLFRYASQYKCPHVCLFDGMRLLVLRFRAKNVDHIRDAACPVDCWIISLDCNNLQNSEAPEGPNNRRIIILYAFYLVIKEGLNNARVMKGVAGLSLGGYKRDFRWFDGKPYWTSLSTPASTVWEHPGGYQRRYNPDSQRWFWCLNNSFCAWDTNPIQ